MELIFYIDPETKEPHIFQHEVSSYEIIEFFNEIAYIEMVRNDGSFEAFGMLKSGRCLRIAYRKRKGDQYFIITGYDVKDKEIINYLRDKL